MKNNNSNLTQILLFSITLGVWGLFLQNLGIIPSKNEVKVVNTVSSVVNGGNITAEVTNDVNIDIKKINGWPAANYNEYSIDGYEFHSLGIHNDYDSQKK